MAKKPSTKWTVRLDRFQKFLKKGEHLQTAAFWAAAFLAGLVSVGYAGLFKMAESAYHRFYEAHPAWVLLWTPLCLVGAWALVQYLAPEAAGSGIPQVLAANDLEYRRQGAWVDRLLSWKGVLVKIASSLLASLGGAVTGREGPTIQVATGIFHTTGKVLRRFRLTVDPQAWIVAGAAAGLASAFNTPLGGIVFAIEEMSVHFKKFRTALITSIIIAGLVSQWIMGSYLYLGYPRIGEASWEDMGVGLLVGISTGLFGALYGRVLKSLLVWKAQLKKRSRLALLAASCGLAMASLSLLDHQASGSGLEVLSSLLFKGESSAWYLPILRAVGSLIFYVSGAAGGIFAPALAAGGCAGSWIASMVDSGSANLLILMGMVGFLTGVTRTPFTAFVLVMEMTDHHAALFPIMLAALASELAARALDKESFYEWARGRFMPSSAR